MARYLDLARILNELRTQRDKYLFLDAAISSSERLPPEEHSQDCPVRHLASSSCVIPVAICVENDFNPPVFVRLYEEQTGEPP